MIKPSLFNLIYEAVLKVLKQNPTNKPSEKQIDKAWDGAKAHYLKEEDDYRGMDAD
jgi:hypothetical protein